MENSTVNDQSGSKFSEYLGTALFFISFLPLIYAIYKSFTGYFFFAWFFGFPAMVFVLVNYFMVFIPIACLIYQIYFFKKHIIHTKKLLKGTLIFFGIIIITILCSCLLAETNLKRVERTAHSKIDPHLIAQFGEAATANMSYELKSRNSLSYEGRSPVLPPDVSFEIQYTDEGEIWDNLITTFKDNNEGFFPEFVQYVIDRNDLPSDMNYRINIVSIDFQDYKNGDNYKVLFERIKYAITGLVVNYQSITEDELMSIINKVWKEIMPKVPADEPSFQIEIKINDRYDTFVNITNHKTKNSATAVIDVWARSSSLSGLNKKAIELTR